MIKLDWTAIGESAARHKGKLIIVALALVLVALGLFLSDCGSNWAFWRGVNKDKEAIKTKVDEIKVISNQIANLEQQKAQKQGELKRDVEAYANSLDAREETRRAADEAIANFQKASNVNANAVNRSADDVLRALEDLK